MKLTQTIDGPRATLALKGDLNTQTAPELNQALTELPGEIKALTLDLGELQYISSAGLRVIQLARKRFGGEKNGLKLIHVSPPVMEILEVTGFAYLLDIDRATA